MKRLRKCSVYSPWYPISRWFHQTTRYQNDYFNGLLPRKGYKKAIVAVARKILRIVWHLLINNEIFEDGIPRVKTVKIPKFPEKIERVGIAKIIQLLSRGAEIIVQEEGKEIMRINGSSQPT